MDEPWDQHHTWATHEAGKTGQRFETAACFTSHRGMRVVDRQAEIQNKTLAGLQIEISQDSIDAIGNGRGPLGCLIGINLRVTQADTQIHDLKSELPNDLSCLFKWLWPEGK